MIRWYHAIISAYGYWLPNDPRGSWSDFVGAYELFLRGGGATTVTGKRSCAHDPHDVQLRREAKRHLNFPPARFDVAAQRSIAAGIARACDEFGFVIHAGAIGFDHHHLVLGRVDGRTVEQVVSVLKARATARLRVDGTHPMRALESEGSIPTPWSKGCWSVFIEDRTQLRNAIEYVERHPMKEGRPKQRWRFVKSV